MKKQQLRYDFKTHLLLQEKKTAYFVFDRLKDE